MNRQPLTLPEVYEVFARLCSESPYTMKQVLEKAGIPQVNSSRWAKGKGRLYHDDVVNLANIFNKPVDVFLYKGPAEQYVHVPRSEYESQVHIPKDELNTWIQELAESVVNTQQAFDAFWEKLVKYVK